MANRKPSELAQLTATNASDNDRLLAYVPAEALAVDQSKTISLGNIRKKINTFNSFINVKDFGATGTYDEAVDQGPAIQAAIAAAYASAGNTGAIVYFPAGMYRVTSPIRTGLTGNNIKLIGAGPVQSAIVQATAGANGFEHGYNPVTIVVASNVATVTCLYPHQFATGTIGSGNQGPLARLPIEFLGPKAVTVISSLVFTCPATIANGNYTGGFLRPGYDRSFSVEGLSFYCGNSVTPNVQGGNAAIVVLDPNGPYQNVWQYVTFKGANFNGANSWAQGVTIYGPSIVQWNHVNVIGKPNAQTQTLAGATGLTLATYSQTNNTTGQIVGAYASLFYKCHFDFWTQSIDMQSAHQSNPAGAEIHGLEGIVFDKIEAGGHNFCKHTNTLGNQSKALSFKFIDCNMEMSGNAFDLQGIDNIQVIRGTILMNGGDLGNVPSGQSIYDDVFRFTNCKAGLISDVEINFFFSIGLVGSPPNNRKRYIYNFASGGTGNQSIAITGNAWEIHYKYGQAVLSNIESAIYLASDSQKIAEKNTNIVLYEGNSPILTKQAGLPANSGCFSTAYVNSFISGNNFVTCDDYGNVELRAQGVVTTDGNRIATVALPAGLFSSVNELIQVQMSGTATADALGYHVPVAMMNDDPTPPTTASFKIKYGASTGMDNKTHRISYYISGKA